MKEANVILLSLNKIRCALRAVLKVGKSCPCSVIEFNMLQHIPDDNLFVAVCIAGYMCFIVTR